MELLTPEKASDQQKETVRLTIDRIDFLRNEEKLAVSALNEAEKNLADALVKINVEKGKAHAEADEFIKEQQNRANKAKAETEAIETYRDNTLKEILRPFNEIKEANEKRTSELDQRENELGKEKETIDHNRQENEKVSAEIEVSMASLNERKKEIITEETRIKSSSEQLRKEWESVGARKLADEKRAKILDEVEAGLITRETAIETRQKEQDNRDIELSNMRRALQSDYEALEQAKKHLGVNQ